MTQGEDRDEDNPYQPPSANLRPIGDGPGEPGEIGPDENPYLTIWTRPRATIRRIVRTDPNRGLIVLAALAGIHTSLQEAALNGVGHRFELGTIVGVVLMIGPIVGLISIFVMGALIRLTGSWLGGRATDAEVRAALVWGSVPTVVNLVTWVLRLLLVGRAIFQPGLPPEMAGSPMLPPLLALVVLELVLALWGFVLLMKCVSEVHGFSVRKALGAWLLALVFLFAILIGVALLALMFAGSGILGRPR